MNQVDQPLKVASENSQRCVRFFLATFRQDRRVTYAMLSLISMLILAQLATPPSTHAAEGTRVVMLGTGTPMESYRRSGPSVAILHKGQAYVFDAGGGMVRRASEAHLRLGIVELQPISICCVFFTHLHGDHLHDYSELASTRWWGRKTRLRAWGPVGLNALTDAMHKMLAPEARMRIATTPKGDIKLSDGYRVGATEIEEGIVFQKGDLTIQAFGVSHGAIKPSFGYKITTVDRSIVISGDTSYDETLIEKAAGVDVLIHEVISAKGLSGLNEGWQRYHSDSHTPTDRLAEIAKQARPKLLVLYHILFMSESEESVLEEVRSSYDGNVILPNDLDIF
jgi:ribonuclease Z